MFPIELYTFNKRLNSTQRPVGSGTVFDGNLKFGTTVINPQIELKVSEAPVKFNYAFIRVFKDQGESTVPGRFYWIDNWTYDRGIWIATMTIDALASWRDEIGELEEYVVRSAQSWDSYLLDILYPARGKIQEGFSGVTGVWDYHFNRGCYILGVISGNGLDRVGAVNYYAMDESQLIILLNTLMKDYNWANIPEAVLNSIIGKFGDNDVNLTYGAENPAGMFKAQFNPIQYIVSCLWFPFPLSAINHGNNTYITVGWWSLPATCTGYILTPANAIKWITKTMSIPRHPQATGGERLYLNLEPFSRYSFFGGVFGNIPLDSTKIANSANLTMDITVDLISGIGTLYLTESSESLQGAFFTSSTMIGVPIQLAQMAKDYLNTIGSAVGNTASVMSSILRGDVAGSIIGATAGVVTGLASQAPQLMTTGTNGSASGYLLQPCIHSWHNLVVDEDIEHRGRPLCKRKKISDLGGYMVIADADVPLPCTSEELAVIKSHMERGFYWQ